MNDVFEDMFGELFDMLDELTPSSKPIREMLEDAAETRYMTIDGVDYELVPLECTTVSVDEYQKLKQERDEWHSFYKQATAVCDSWRNRYDELHVRYLNAIHDLEAAKAKAGMYQEQADKLRRRVAQIERKEDDAEKVFHANVRLRKQLNKQAVGVVENA